MKDLFLSRSALEAYQTCPRLYYITYQMLGRGVVPARQSLDLADGIARHAGLAALNQGASTEEAVKTSLESFKEQTSHGIEDVPDSLVSPTLREHAAIVEAGIRIWAAVRQPVLNQEYDVLTVEQEMSFELRKGVIFEGRPDAVLASKFNGKLFSYSLKNPRVYYPSKHPDSMIDMQGRSESWLLGNKYGHDMIGGVLMDYVFTGKESDDDARQIVPDGSGADAGGFTITDAPSLYTPKIRWTPMTRGWIKDLPDNTTQIAWRYKYLNPNYDPTLPRAKGNYKETTFGKSNRIAAWEYPGGVKAWVDDLLAKKFVPQNIDPLSELAYSPATYYRQPEQIVSFLYKLIKVSEDIEEALDAVTPKDWESVTPGWFDTTKHPLNLDYHFPQYETSCINKFGKRCRAWDICHRGAGRDPLNNGFKVRDPHHTKEAESLV